LLANGACPALNHVSGGEQHGEMDETMIETIENDI